ncbi:hypothetical protein ACFSYD_05865 [Paracoccus aerius]
MLEEFGGIEGIIRFGNSAAPADFARLAPRIVTGDDPAARQVFDAAVAEVRHILTVLQGMRRCRWSSWADLARPMRRG